MSQKRIQLDCAAFLDSPPARALEGGGGERLRRQARLLLTACYEELGKRPELLDGQDVEVLLTQLLPMRLDRRDELASDLPDVLGALIDHLEQSRPMPLVFEARLALEQQRDAFHVAVEEGALAGQRAKPRQAPTVHHAPKLGRNDPCFCGSGKKFKKCHGKGQ